MSREARDTLPTDPPARQTFTEFVGRYAIYGEIAAGGMATVHFGRLMGPVGFSRPVAIKRLHPHLAREHDVRAMFIDEARLAARIHHPNVVQTLDVISASDQLLIVLEYVNGAALSELANAHRGNAEPIPLGITLAIITNVLHGLHAAHEATSEAGQPLRIVHRDVSPHNIMVGIDGVARVLDFGIARASVRLESTRAGVVKGKLSYMAPEQLLGAIVTRQADLFSTGIVLWEMLAGRRIFPHADDPEGAVIEKLLRCDFDAPSVHASNVPASLDAIVKRALSREPGNRFGSAREMALALEGVAPLASASQIGAWVERVASPSLAARQAKLREVEQSSSRPSADTDADAHVERRLAAEALIDVSQERTIPQFERRTHFKPAPSSTASSSAPASRWLSRARVVTLAAFGIVATLSGVAWRITRARTREPGEPKAIAPKNLAAAAPAVLAAPTCPGDMREIPGGRFFMGSDDDLPAERPAHNVTLHPYCIDTDEVTTSSYFACSERGDCKRASTANDWRGITAEEHKTYDPLCNVRDTSTKKDHPINCVDWDMARIYCKAHGKRLPSEAEWEFAARGPDGRKYPWGDEAPSAQRLNACGKECVAWGRKNGVDFSSMYDGDDGWPTTAPVGTFPRGASRYGVEDVVGNVWEWVSDFYGEYSPDDQVDPHGPERGEAHVIRGGAWNGAHPAWVRSTFRYTGEASKRSYGIGFRCAKSI